MSKPINGNAPYSDAHYIVNVLEYLTVNSTATRKKVGALIVKEGIIRGHAFNSVPRTMADQSCEDEHGKTRPEVMHAEAKAIAMCALNGHSTRGSTLYCTIPPCPVCSGLIIEAGIKRVVYKEAYWSEGNLDLLTKAGITVSKFKE